MPRGHHPSHCKYGHEFTQENTLAVDGRRLCRECRRRRWREQNERRRGGPSRQEGRVAKRKPVAPDEAERRLAIAKEKYGETCPRGHAMTLDNIARRTFRHGTEPVESFECRVCVQGAKPKKKKRTKYKPNPLDSAVQTAREERARVLHMRAKYGNEWWRKVA